MTTPGHAAHDTEPVPEPEEPYQRTTGPVHGWFGLTYANYMVLPRTLLQSMPLAWQTQFVELLEDLHAGYPDVEIPDYEVTTVRDSYVGELTSDEMKLLGITRGDAAAEPDEAGDAACYDKTGRELTIHDHVGVPVPDTMPHYKRSYLPPDEAAIALNREQRAELKSLRQARRS